MWYNGSAQQILSRLNADKEHGLTQAEATKRLEVHGSNELEQKKSESLLKRFLSQFKDYMVIILLICAAVSFFMSIINGDADYFDPIIILAIVIINASIGVFQESRAQKALEALKRLGAPSVYVLRDGEKKKIDSSQLVVGDIIFLKSGDLVPADARLIESNDLRCDEASLTGESIPVEKDALYTCSGEINIADAKNMVFSSCIVTSGNGLAVVVETGMNTQVGKIAKMIIDTAPPQTPLQEKLARTGKTLGTVALIICFVIFIMGIIRRINIFEMLMTSISLAVAAIPEGLPSIVTIILSLGVGRMARKNAIIRRMSAVETLGSASVICSDKTGTLTQNKMSVVSVYGTRSLALDLGSLCNNDSDATEKAIIQAARLDGCDIDLLKKKYLRVREIPFDSKNKYMSTTHKTDSGYRVIVKGAPDVLLDMCDLSYSQRENIEKENLKMAHKALRVIAVAYKDIEDISENTNGKLNFVGLISMIDPPRPEAAPSVASCIRAGIKPVMITGDHIETAKAIASQIGIYKNNDKAMTGAQLNEISDDELAMIINEYSVFARVTPEHKVRIVNAFERRGEVVAMTGDGVNDAPALKIADIGCAMGQSGTQVCTEAADMVLCDDNFSTIVSSVKEGRVIFSNIKKALHFLLSSNIGEIVTIFFAILIGWNAPLAPIHLLWVNLVTDSLPAIALGFEKADEDIMDKKPISRRKSIFADGLGTSIVLEGIMIGVLALIGFSFGRYIWNDMIVAQTMAFCVLCLSQLVHAFNTRSEGSLFKVGAFSNKVMNVAFIICCALQMGVVCIAPISKLFKVTPLSYNQWFVVMVLALLPLVIVETEKYLSYRSAKKRSMKKRFLFER